MTKPTTEQRFWAKVRTTETCWLWTGSTGTWGYGTISIQGKPVGAHRWLYEQINGPVPSGMELDHLCRVRRCVNPAHLEPVTRRENLLRGDTFASRHAAQTHCVHGHPFDAANTYVDAANRRTCRACRRERMRRYGRAKG